MPRDLFEGLSIEEITGGQRQPLAAEPVKPTRPPRDLFADLEEPAGMPNDDPRMIGKPVDTMALSQEQADRDPFALGRSFIRSPETIGKGIAEGATTELPRMIGDALQYVEPDILKEKLGDPGKSLSEWAEKKSSEWFGGKEDYNSFDKILNEGSKMFAPSVIPMKVIGWGSRILFGVGKTAKALKAAQIAGDAEKVAELTKDLKNAAKWTERIAGAGTGATFGASQGQQTLETAEAQAQKLEAEGKPDEAQKIRDRSGWASLATATIEGTGEYFGTKALGRMLGMGEKAVAARGTTNTLADFFRTLGVEVGTEMGQSGGQAAVEKYTAIRPDADWKAEALNVVGPTIFLTMLTGGLAKGAEALTRPKSKAKETLLDEGEKDLTAKEILTGEKEQPAADDITNDISDEYVPTPLTGNEPPVNLTGDMSIDAEEAAAEFTDGELDIQNGGLPTVEEARQAESAQRPPKDLLANVQLADGQVKETPGSLPQKPLEEPGDLAPKLAPSIADMKSDEAEDISNASYTSNAFKNFIADYGITREGAMEVKKAQIKGESITLQEAENRAGAKKAENDKARAAAFSEEGKAKEEADWQKKIASEKKDRLKTFTDLGGGSLEDGRYEDVGTGLIYEVRTDPKTGRRSILSGEGADIRPYGMVTNEDADSNAIAFAAFVGRGEVKKQSPPSLSKKLTMEKPEPEWQGVSIPELNSSADGARFGLVATPEQVIELERRYAEGEAESRRLRDEKKPEEAYAVAQKNQFYNDALHVIRDTPVGKKLKAKLGSKQTDANQKDSEGVGAVGQVEPESQGALPDRTGSELPDETDSEQPVIQPVVPETPPTDTKTKLTYVEFKKAYTTAFKNMNKYTTDQAGAQVYAEEMAKLSDEYPDWAEQVEEESAAEQPAPKPEKPETKREKAEREYREFIQALTPEQKEAAGKLVITNPGSPSVQKAKIQKAIAEKKVPAKQEDEAPELIIRSLVTGKETTLKLPKDTPKVPAETTFKVGDKIKWATNTGRTVTGKVIKTKGAGVWARSDDGQLESFSTVPDHYTLAEATDESTTLEDAEKLLSSLKAQEKANGRIADDRLSQRIRQAEKVVSGLKAETKIEPKETPRPEPKTPEAAPSMADDMLAEWDRLAKEQEEKEKPAPMFLKNERVRFRDKLRDRNYSGYVSQDYYKEQASNVSIIRDDGQRVFIESEYVEPINTESLKAKGQEVKDHLSSAVDRLKQINDILGEGGEAGPDIDPKKWELIRPILADTWKDIKAAGQSIKEFVALAFKTLGPKGRKYFEKFVKEELPKIESLTNQDEGVTSETETPSTKEVSNERPLRRPSKSPDAMLPGGTETEVSGQQEGAVPGDSGIDQPGDQTSQGTEGEGPADGSDQRDSVPDGSPPGRSGGRGTTKRKPSGKDNAVGGEPAGESSSLKPEDQNHAISESDEIVPPGAEGKIKGNIRAIQLLKKLQSEDRNPSPDEKKILAQYVGWGAFSQKVFNRDYTRFLDARGPNGNPDTYFYGEQGKAYKEWKSKYGDKLHPLLGGLMSKEEWDSASASTINAHYTSREIINSMWSMAKRLGFKGGTVLEPAAGVGHFFGLMPQDIAAQSVLFGIEKDTLSGAILQKLYPQANVQVTPFEKSKSVADNSIDLTITNVPFADIGITDKRHPDYSGWKLHNYFIARALTATKPGGIVMAVTSNWTMDAMTNGKIRDYFGNHADLIGAIRLPNTAFKANAGTEVVTDILIFRKKDSSAASLGKEFRTSSVIDEKSAKSVIKEHQAAIAALEALKAKAPASDASSWQKGYFKKQLEGAKAAVEEAYQNTRKLHTVNEYFHKHPEMVLGKHSMTGSMYSSETYTVEPTGNLQEQLDSVINTLPKNIAGEGTDLSSLEKVQYADLGAKEGTVTLKDGKPMLVSNGKLIQPKYTGSNGQDILVSGDLVMRLKEYIGVRDAAANMIKTMGSVEATEAEISALQKDLNKKYDAFVSKHGQFNKNVKTSFLRKLDNDFAIVDALEVAKNPDDLEDGDDKVTYIKAPIFSKRTIYPFVEPDSASNIEDAANLSIIYRGELRPAYIAELLGIQDVEAVKKQLVDAGLGFINPDSGMLEQRDLYLSGNVKKKLAKAKAAAESDNSYKPNVEALEKVVPEDIDIEFVTFRLGTTWIPGDAIRDFMREVIEVDAKIEYMSAEEASKWDVNITSGFHGVKNTKTYGTDDYHAHDLVKMALNLQRAKVMVPGETKGSTVEDKKASAEANLKIREISDEFVRWAKSNPEWGKKLADIYNAEKNGSVLRTHAEPAITHYPNASTDVTLRPHQKIAISRALQESVLLAYGVGTGKTYILITAAMEMKRIGTSRKPLLVVHNQTIDQYRNSFKTLYPGAKVLIPDMDQRSSKMRKKTLVSMATGDWDAIVLPQSFFDGIANDPERERAFVDEQLAAIEQLLDQAKDEEGAKSFTVKEFEKLMERKRQKLESLLDRRKDEAVTFEDMGIDALLIDEVHAYKRSEFYTKLSKVKGIDQGSSQRSTSLILKSEFVRSKTGGKNVITATGTPISNTLAELWTMLRYVRPDLLNEYGIGDFDSFATTFGDIVEDVEETASGYKEVERFSRYINGPELLTMFYRGADVRLSHKAGLKLPELKGGKPEQIVNEKSPALKAVIKDIIDQWRAWEKLPGKEKRAQRHVPLQLYGKAKKATVDLRLLDPDYYLDEPDNKINTAANKIYEVWKGTRKNRSTQIVFLDLINDNSKNPKFNLHKELQSKLTKKGIPENEILLFSETGNNEKLQARMKERIRSGDASVIIGTTSKLGIGIDIAKKLIAAHHINVPDRPMDIEQRDGRIVRQGNENEEVQIYHYATKDTIDSVLFQRLMRKQKGADQVLTGDISGRDFDDPFSTEQATFSEFAAAASGKAGKLLFEKTELMSKQNKYQVAEQAFIRKVSDAKRKVAVLPDVIKQDNESKKQAEDFAAYLKKAFPDAKLENISVDGKDMPRKEAYEIITQKIEAAVEQWRKQYIGKPMGDFASSAPSRSHGGIPVVTEKINTKVGDLDVVLTAVSRTNFQHTEKPSAKLQFWKHTNADTGKEEEMPVQQVIVNISRNGDNIDRFDVSGYKSLPAIMTRAFNQFIENKISKPAAIQQEISREEKDLEEYKNIAKEPFKYTDELKEIRKRIAEINTELTKLDSEDLGNTGVETSRVESEEDIQMDELEGLFGDDETKLAMASTDAPGTDRSRRNIARDVTTAENLLKGSNLVLKAMRASGLPESAVNRISIELKPVIDLRGKNVEKTVKDWADQGQSVSRILGATTIGRMSATVQLSLEQNWDTMERTAYHESFHVAADWVLPKPQYAALMKFYKNNEERAAEEFADFMTGKKVATEAPGLVRQALISLKEFLRKLGGFLRGAGFTTPEQIFSDLIAGKFGDLREGDGGTRIAFQVDTTDITDQVFPEEVAKRIKASKGVAKESFLKKIKDWAVDMSHQRQHFPELSKIANKDERARLADILRRHQEVPETAKDKAVRLVSSFIKGLSESEYTAFRLHVLMADMMKDIKSGLLIDGNLPFGFETTAEAEDSFQKLDAISQNSPKLKDALDRRAEAITELKKQSVKAKILKKEVLNDDAYFHHQVLAYWGEKPKGTGTSSGDVRTHWRGWMVARKGSALDYNTEYAQAEFTAISQQIAQIETAETMRRVKEESDIYTKLRDQAKAANVAAIKAMDWGMDSKGKPVDPLLPFRQQIAMGNSGLAKMAENGDLFYDSEFQDIIDQLADGLDVDDPRWFHFLSDLMSKNRPGAIHAAGIFKAIKGRDRFIQNTLGDKFKTYQNFIPEGYVQWKPSPNKGWFYANTMADNIMQKLISGEIQPADAEFKKILAKGRDLIWIIPEGLANTMDNFRTFADTTALGKASDWFMRAWKQYILLNPYTVLKYNINNESGDLDAILAYAPAIAGKYAVKAAKDLARWHRNKTEPAAAKELAKARKLGVIGSGFSVQEIDDVLKIMSMDKAVREVILDEKPNYFNPRTWAEKYWQGVKGVTAWRENTLRLAAYRYFMDNKDKRLYGASNPVEIDAIKNPEERAAKLARELLGDYGNISHSGEYIRKRLIPFFSWLEINAPRYVYMMRNTKYENREPGAGSVRGRMAAVAGKKMILSAAGLAIRAQILFALVHIWNHVMFPDEEEEFGEQMRRQLHIILGRREDGKIISLRFQGAWSDVLSFFGLEDWPDDISDLTKGTSTIAEKLQDAGSAILNRFAQGIRPEIKMFAETATGTKLYPDVLNPMPNRDRVENILKTFKLDKIYNYATGKPGRGKTMADHFISDLKTLLVYESDPGEMAYYSARKLVFDWLAEQGAERSYGKPTKKGNALYYYRQALKFGDLEAAERYLQKYYDMGGTPKTLKQSLKMAHPLSSIAQDKRYKFRRTLTDEQQETVKAALEWYKKTYR